MHGYGPNAAQRGRYAIAALFFVNGFLMGSWAPQIPLLLSRLAITETTVGLLILVFGVGAILAMPWAGGLIGQFGSRRAVSWFAPAASFGLAAVALSPNVPAVAMTLFLLGAFAGAMDVAMNANAVEVEKRLGRAIMSSSHGFWSLGGFAGSAVGGPLIAMVGGDGQAIVASFASLAVVLAAAPALVADAPHPEEVRARPRGMPRDPAIWLIGLMALFAMTPEGAVLDWSAIYLGKELGAGVEASGLAFAAFSAAMATMRFAGDAVRNRFGAVRTLRLSALSAAAGLLLAALAPNATLAIAAFAFAGIGMANTVPIALSAAGNHPGLSPGAGLAVVTFAGYSGILLAPSVIGWFGERFGFAPVYGVVAAMLIVVALLAGRARAADQPAA
ncbi:MAG: MFS transporter [Phyllobacteriaceae bacterium]|nr:MFS transporter [Phyllobacteriaceae bacterium]